MKQTTCPQPAIPASAPEPLREISALQLLHRIAMLAATTRNRADLLTLNLKELQQAFAADGGGIYQLPEPDAPLQLVAQHGLTEELVRALQRVPAGEGLMADVVTDVATYNWPDLQHTPQLRCQEVVAAGWRSLLAQPLVAHSRLLGILFLYQRQADFFTAEQASLLGQCAQLLAAAIDSSELVEKLEWQHRLTHASQRELNRSRQQLREHVSRLEESNRSLEQANRMKDRFLALASHELRTPLTWIVTATDMLGSDQFELPSDSKALLETIAKGGERLSRLVEDLLEMARIEARDIYLAQEHIDLSLLFGELASQYRSEALRRQLELHIGEIPDHIAPIGDYYHLRQALERLLKNALKFTPAGGSITLEARHCSSDELRRRQPQMEPFCPQFFRRRPLLDHLEISVSDTGVGIAEQDRLLIFDKFHGAGDISLHGKQQHSVQGPSAGLGLPLAKGMIEAHGGMIWLESAAGSHGSCFRVLLPLFQPQQADHD